ncbi:MAG: putative baseplate assembly protein [Actinomycetota bacterium]|nr:putative baseplate assembly protein [Actinomycetota bacterium]
MSLPSPNLDDRAFQDFVDEAKRLLQQRAPEWTDNNVADPGVTLIETFAYMVDQLVFRLNKVPDLHWIKFLDFLGETLRPPAAAYTTMQFSLAVAQSTDILVPASTVISTVRRGEDPPVSFTTDREMVLVSTSITSALTQPVGGAFKVVDITDKTSEDVECFSDVPAVGDAFFIGLNKPASNCIIRLTVDSRIEGIGVDPKRPPRAFDAWNGRSWEPVECLLDTTGGFNRKGTVELSIGEQRENSLNGLTASWLRVRVTETQGDQPEYKESPKIRSMAAETIGGFVPATHCQIIKGEMLGRTAGTPGESFALNRIPLIAGQEDLVLEVSTPDGWEKWTRVETFANRGPSEKIFTLDNISGELRFGPMVRLPDGSTRNYGATPPSGSNLRVPLYRAGGGVVGNVDSGSLRLLRTSIPFITKVKNIHPAVGGVDAESIDDLKARAAINVRARNRAVSAADFELLTQQASPSLVRTKCLNGADFGSPGTVLVLVVPDIQPGRVPFELLRPRNETLDSVKKFIDERRLVGTTVRIEPPRYLGISVAARVALHVSADEEQVLSAADAAIAQFLHPLYGGYGGDGWPFGRDLSVGDIYSVLQKVPGLLYVDVARLIPIDAVSGVKAEPTDKVSLKPHDLIYSFPSDFEVISQ